MVNLSSVKNDSIRDATELVTAYDLKIGRASCRERV